MARFRARISGAAKTEATRIGHSERNALTTHTNGWDCGITVIAEDPNPGNEEITDRFRIYLTGGTDNPNRSELIFVAEHRRNTTKLRFLRPDGQTIHQEIITTVRGEEE